MQRNTQRLADLARPVYWHQAMLGAFPTADRRPVNASSVGQPTNAAGNRGDNVDVHLISLEWDLLQRQAEIIKT